MHHGRTAWGSRSTFTAFHLFVCCSSLIPHPCHTLLPAQEGGLGDLAYPLVADLKKEISEAYGVLTEDGIALRGLFIIDKEGVVQHATINNLAFGRSVDETKRVLQVRRTEGQ